MAHYKDLRIEWDSDSDPDLSWLGTYQAHKPYGEVYIDRYEGCMYAPDNDGPVMTGLERCHDKRSMRYYTSCSYAQATSADEYSYIAADYARLEAYNNGEWYMRFCRAVATIVFDSERGLRTEQETSSGLGGIESDCGADYEREVEAEQVAELRAMLIEQGLTEK